MSKRNARVVPPHVPFTRSEIAAAAEYFASLPDTTKRHTRYGLCFAFSKITGRYGAVREFLVNVGGGPAWAWLWPLTRRGYAQRLTMLAFMLTWKDDE